MFYEYQVRIHSDPRRDDDVKQWLNSRAEQWYLAYEKNANRAHYQMYMKSKYKEQSLRRYIKEELKLSGNRQYSISLLRKEPKDLVCYLMKEGTCVDKKIDMTIVSEAEAQAEEIHETQAKPKDRFKTTVQQIMDTITVDNPDQRQLRVFVYAFFWKKRRLLPDKFQIDKYVRTLYAYIGGGQNIIDMINEDLWEDPNRKEVLPLMEQIFLYETE